VRVAESFVAAREALRVAVPDWVLCDVDLGVERADEELPKLAKEGVLPPTLIVSGYVDAELEERLLAIPGVVGLIRKPFDFAMLEARVDSALSDARAADDEDGWVEVRAFEDEA
jgi:DNA-binding response OmpR family regulator